MPEPLNLGPALRAHPDGTVVSVHANPGAGRSQVAGLHGDAVKVKLAAPAVDGKANAELVRFLAELTGVRSGDVELVSGAHSRTKRVLLRGLDPTTVAAHLAR